MIKDDHATCTLAHTHIAWMLMDTRPGAREPSRTDAGTGLGVKGELDRPRLLLEMESPLAWNMLVQVREGVDNLPTPS